MSIRRTLAARSLHLRIQPEPSNLSESREIFRVLQQFGELHSYKYLRYEYQNPADNVALAIFREERAAQAALEASPIRFALEKPMPANTSFEEACSQPNSEEDESAPHSIAPKTGIDEMLRPTTATNRTLYPPEPPRQPKPTPPSMPFDDLLDQQSPPYTDDSDSNTSPRTWKKTFQITFDRSRVIQQDHIERQPYWKQFSPMKSMAQADLAKRVPHIGLSDVSKRPPSAHRTPVRVLRGMSDYVANRMPTLSGMMEDNEREVGFRERRGIDARGFQEGYKGVSGGGYGRV